MLYISKKDNKIYKYKIGRVYHNTGSTQVTKLYVSVKQSAGYENYIITIFDNITAKAWDFSNKIDGDMVAIYGMNKISIDNYNGKTRIELICEPSDIGIFKNPSSEVAELEQTAIPIDDIPF